ncbi:uncharacterized protein Socs36E [Eurosta solidaginis]|uniref:uncharacterized protein Socs36E n=1 Tax=Eurosta solidaginis TaxID=178769 RepID=UPI003530CE00
MGHRSSKQTAGLTDGNTSNSNNNTNKNIIKAKLTKQSTRRHTTSRFPKSPSSKNVDNNNYSDKKNYRHSVATTSTNNIASDSSNNSNANSNNNIVAPYEDNQQFLPILQLESDSLSEKSASVVNNSAGGGGQIIIKIRFKTHSESEMDNTQQRSTTTAESQSEAARSSTVVSEFSEDYRPLTDTNSNQMIQVVDDDVDVRRGTAGSSLCTMLNNNNNVRAPLPLHLNALRIVEPNGDGESNSPVEYHEITNEEESASTSRRNRPESGSRRQKAKSAFMNFKSKLECSGHSKTQLDKVSNVINNNNNNNNNIKTSDQISCTHHHSYIGIPQRHSMSATTTKAAVNGSSIYHATPLRNRTSTSTITPTPTPISITATTSATAIATALSTQPPIITTTATSNPQLAIWATNNKDVIISSINLLVCPSSTTSTTTGVTLERLMATELAAVATTNGAGVLDVSTAGGQVSSSSTIPATMSTATIGPIVHSQVDFVHYLVPDLERIFNSSFYWGKMDRYEAERLLEGKPEGTFLLRDSAQEEYLFSVTFRKYGRSLHARIEQNGHKFSFDCHDPAVFSTSTVTGLLEHYKDPGSVMFFEPMLTVPFHRKTVFSLQQLSRAAIVSNTSYDGISELELPVRLKAYLKEYHYKQKLRVKLLDETILTCT